jgi:hypothetical protein
MAEIKFRGKVMRIVEEDYGASLADDEEGAFVQSLYKQYLDSGSPKNQEAWLREQLSASFLFAVSPPKWIERTTTPRWPFLNGKPMVFITQVTTPQSQVSDRCLSTNTMLYIFGARIVDDEGWKMEYRIIEQEPGL